MRYGRADIPKDFTISPDNLEANTTKSMPKFNFSGTIYTINCSFNEVS